MKVALAALGVVVVGCLLWTGYAQLSVSSDLSYPRVIEIQRQTEMGIAKVPHAEWMRDGIVHVRPGDFIVTRYNVYRYQDCTVELRRTLVPKTTKPRGGGGKSESEILVTLNIQSFAADRPSFERPSGFRIQIPPSPANPNVTPPGDYWLIPKGRYYCHGPDWIIPRRKNFPGVELTVIGEEE
jgi:hypothetical protein